jgi:hypothetical protein
MEGSLNSSRCRDSRCNYTTEPTACCQGQGGSRANAHCCYGYKQSECFLLFSFCSLHSCSNEVCAYLSAAALKQAAACINKQALLKYSVAASKILSKLVVAEADTICASVIVLRCRFLELLVHEYCAEILHVELGVCTASQCWHVL